jgi:hypothetical protein
MSAYKCPLCALEKEVQLSSVCYNATCSIRKQHTDWDDNYVQTKSLLVSTDVRGIHVARCRLVSLDKLYIVTCPVLVQSV